MSEPTPPKFVKRRKSSCAGGVVAHATEGVWGLACLADRAVSVMRVLSIKRRPVSKGLIVVCGAIEGFAPELESLAPQTRAEIAGTWPGPVTWVVPNVRFSQLVTGGRPTIAVRVPGHDQARALCDLVGAPLVSTSANIGGEPSPTTEADTRAAMARYVDMVLPGATNGTGAASEVRSVDGEVFRQGGQA